MQKEKLRGCSFHNAEIVVDYKNNKTELKGIPPDSLVSKVGYVLWEWIKTLGIPFIVVLMLSSFVNSYTRFYVSGNQIFFVFCIIALLGMSLHLNKNWDKRLRKYFAKRTAYGNKNRLSITELNSKEFIIYDTKNITVDFDTSGDFSKYLSKVWIKQEHPSAILLKQGKIEDLFFVNGQNPVWNVHFIFEEIPKTGFLSVEYI